MNKIRFKYENKTKIKIECSSPAIHHEKKKREKIIKV